MTPSTIRELVEALRKRYRRATKAEKGRILDEFCATTSYHRKSATRALNKKPPPVEASARSGRPRQYRPELLLPILVAAWEASGYICGKRLAPFLGELLDSLLRHHAIPFEPELCAQLAQMSAATIDRMLRPVRQARLRHPHVSTPTVASLAHKVATHTFADLRKLPLGYMEVDLALHCGVTTEDFYLTTLVGVEILTGWCECLAVWGKGQERVGGAIARMRRRLPFALKGICSDNGGEFLNQHLYDYCRRTGIAFSHSRPYHKNDQPRVEQRNGSIVRQLIGYERYKSHAAHEQLNRIYELLRLHFNFFQPVRKLTACQRQGARVTKHYDVARTPYQRLCEVQPVGETRAALQQLYLSLNPLQLQRQIEAEIAKLWTMAEPDPRSQKAALASETTQQRKGR